MTTSISIARETLSWDAPAALSEELLIQRARAGDHSAFEVIFNRHQEPIYNYIARMMGSRDDAPDMTQDTFLKAFLALPRTREDLKMGAWLFRIAHNVCLDELRHRNLIRWMPWEGLFWAAHDPTNLVGGRNMGPRTSRHRFPGRKPVDLFVEQVAGADAPTVQMVRTEQAEAVQAVLALLPPHYRAVLILREYQDLQYSEIGSVMGITRPAVKSLLWRARAEFRAKWERQEQTEAACA